MIAGRRRADDARARGLGDLHRRRAHAARRAVNQHRLTLLDLARLVQRAIGGFRGDGHARGLVEGQRFRLARQTPDGNHRIFGITTALAREAQHLLAHLPARDAFAQCVDDAGDISTRHLAHATRGDFPVDRIDRRGPHLDEHFTRTGFGHGHFLHRQFRTLTDLHAAHLFGCGQRRRAHRQRNSAQYCQTHGNLSLN